MLVQRPDVALLVPEWPERVLLRAQLIEEGYEVLSVDAWPLPQPFRSASTQPRVVLVDLRGLSDPRATLAEVRSFLPPDRVIVISALGSLNTDDVRKSGFEVIERPLEIAAIVEAVRSALSRTPHA
jgi:DNA-binding NtrC family response regulator